MFQATFQLPSASMEPVIIASTSLALASNQTLYTPNNPRAASAQICPPPFLLQGNQSITASSRPPASRYFSPPPALGLNATLSDQIGSRTFRLTINTGSSAKVRAVPSQW